jgi:uncharacterized NAD(P)/FAD-binding protein YdhS
MTTTLPKRKIGIIGGGPAALFVYKQLIETGRDDIEVVIFEKKEQLGSGMPYSRDGACDEHITNVSDTEIPELVSPMKEWIFHAPPDLLKRFDIKPGIFNEYKVVPRLLFGEYLASQFDLLLKKGKNAGILTTVYRNTAVTDIKDIPGSQTVRVDTDQSGTHEFDTVIICTGHSWPKKQEGIVPGWFDSPYPPSKLDIAINTAVAIKGSSLSAIDAMRTLARQHGTFVKDETGSLVYQLDEASKDFRLVMHSIKGLLPAVRFHLEESKPPKESLMEEQEIAEIKEAHGGFVPLDYIFDRFFKEPLRQQDPAFFEKIRDLNMEGFVNHVMSFREKMDPFQLFEAEFAEAEKSIKREQSVHWKEMLAELSYAMNYPAKHFSAEDMLRLKKVLMPLISIVIAFVPQNSCREMIALYEAGVLSLVAVDAESSVQPAEEGGVIYRYTDEQGKKQEKYYSVFVDAVGQKHFMYGDFPFEGLRSGGTVSPAHLRFRSKEEGERLADEGNEPIEKDQEGNFYLKVPGININDRFQVLDRYGAYNERVYIMAVPFIGGLNPDYSGLDFCEAASERIVKAINARTPVQQATGS